MTYPQPGYPLAAPQYPQQFAPQPFAQPQYGQPQYGAAPAPGYPPMQMAPPPPPLAAGSLDAFYSQPTGGGGAFLKFEQVGQFYAGFVARAITSADIRQVTTPPNQGSVPQTYRDGRPKFEMLVPLQLLAPSQQNPDGMATWACKSAGERAELTRAMSEAGAPEGPPEAGAFIQITYTQARPSRGGIPEKVKQVVYLRPGDPSAPPKPQPVQAPPAQPVYAPPPQFVNPAQAMAYAPPAQQFQQPPAQYAPQPGQYLASLPGQPPVAMQANQQPDAVGPPVQYQATAPAQAPAQPQYAPPAQPAPAQQPLQVGPNGMVMPTGLDPQQQAIFDNLVKAQQGPQPTQ